MLARAFTFMSNSVGAHSGSRRRRKLGKRAQTFLPDDVVMNILSWLPAKNILGYRCVCKVWRDLTSSKDFIDLHSRRSIPMILKDDSEGQTLLDRCWEPAQTKSKIHKLYRPPDLEHRVIVFSHNGLIVVDDRRYLEGSVFIIYNPIYRHVVKIRASTRPKYAGRVCGVFFHPVQNEYCILWEKILSREPCKVQYRILNLESDPKWLDIATQNRWIWYIHPVLIDKYLYWIVEPSQRFDDYPFNCEVMEYDIIKEEFRVIPCPVRIDHENVNLLDCDGILSLIHVITSKGSVEINIWTLNDGGEQPWKSCNYVVSNDLYSRYRVPKAIAFRNGELVLQSNTGRIVERLYVCNLEYGTFRKFGGKYKCWEKRFPHVTSLVSLKKCKSNIFMADE